MATGLYWCLVLTECLSLVVCCKYNYWQYNYRLLTAAVLTQTAPSYIPVCPGDRLVVTCVTNGTSFTYWRYNSTTTSARIDAYGAFSHGVLVLSATNISGTTITSTGTIESVTVSMNGTMIDCSPTLNANDFDSFIINIRGNHLFLFILIKHFYILKVHQYLLV